MNVKAVALILLAGPAFGQGFAGLGTDVQGFATPERGAFQFPADLGAHPAFRIEWWYVTANLTAADGTAYGAQWTLFRSALAPFEAEGWASPQIWLAHAALTSESRHLAAERRARGGIGQAGVTAAPFLAWIDDWQLSDRMTAEGDGFAFGLSLTANGPLVPQGEGGYSVKSAAGQASRYYSQPFYAAQGEVVLDGQRVPVTGTAWMDREWSSQPLAEDQSGWDWFSLSFDDGARLMGFRLRGAEDFVSATWINPDGRPEPQPPGALRLTPLRMAKVAEREVPVEWRLELPAKGLDITTRALNDQSWNALSVPYWEGPIRATGTHPGRGYLEMTGYAEE
ncbi:lipocalin-like domain-containing protein [Falsirhodobacter sp. 1013]|uniref:lipocalin-like domain-containing protein n=1 Tax=Falsirhodobacter sp. 1013 TaxID=3417566 RepID=UPI003EBF8B7E